MPTHQPTLLRPCRTEGTAVDCVRASSYGGGTSSSGRVQLSGLVCSCKGRHVLLVEDIVDTGRTLAALKAAVLEEGAASVRVATLLDKQSRRVNGERPDYAGFACPDEFVVGCAPLRNQTSPER